MKKFTLFFIFFYFIFNIEGNAATNKVIKILEKCADNAFIKSNIGPKIHKTKKLKDEFEKDKKYVSLKTKSRIDAEIEKKNKTELFNFIEKYFKDAKVIQDKLYAQIIRKVYLKEDIDFNKLPQLKSINNNADEYLKEKNELKEKTLVLVSDAQKSYESSKKEWDYRRDKFLNSIISLKLVEKSYEKKFIKCEITRKKAPITFDAKWQ
jgi:hypothetical protein